MPSSWASPQLICAPTSSGPPPSPSPHTSVLPPNPLWPRPSPGPSPPSLSLFPSALLNELPEVAPSNSLDPRTKVTQCLWVRETGPDGLTTCTRLPYSSYAVETSPIKSKSSDWNAALPPVPYLPHRLGHRLRHPSPVRLVRPFLRGDTDPASLPEESQTLEPLATFVN